MCPSTEYSAPYCGDGESSGEECDATAGDDGCYAPGHASECTREPLVCDTTDITTNPSYEGEQVTFDIYMFDESYIQMDSELYYGDGEDSGSWTIDGGTYNHTYTSGGTYNWSYQILHT